MRLLLWLFQSGQSDTEGRILLLCNTCMAVQQNGGCAVEQVFEYLKAAQSPQPEVQKAAEAALKSLEVQSGFCSCLAVSDSYREAMCAWRGS